MDKCNMDKINNVNTTKHNPIWIKYNMDKINNVNTTQQNI